MFKSIRVKILACLMLLLLLLIGSAIAEKPVFTVTFDKDSYKAGETVKAHYKIDFDEKYTELGAEWFVVTDWEKGNSQSADGVELSKREGDLSFTPKYGEGVELLLYLTDANGRNYYDSSDPVRLYPAQDTILSKSLTVIKEQAFEGAKFTQVVCPDGLLAIGSRAFAGCENLMSITIPASVESIADDAFDGCAALVTIITERNSAAAEFAHEHGYELDYL